MKTKQAIAEVRKWANTIKAFQKLTEIADQLAGADQLFEEQASNLIVLNEQIATADTALESKGAALLAKHDELNDMEATAQAERDTIISQANGRAADIVGEARANLDRFTEEGQAEVIKLRHIRTEITKRQADLDALMVKLDKARTQARQILEGGT